MKSNFKPVGVNGIDNFLIIEIRTYECKLSNNQLLRKIINQKFFHEKHLKRLYLERERGKSHNVKSESYGFYELIKSHNFAL